MILIRKISKPGIITSLYFVLYGLVRVIVEGLRTDSLYIGATGIRVSQLLSAVLVVGGIIAIIFIILYDKWKELQPSKTDKSKGPKR